MIGRELIERIAAEFHVSLDLCNDPEIVLKEGRCLIYGPDGRLWVWRPSNRPGLAVKELARKWRSVKKEHLKRGRELIMSSPLSDDFENICRFIEDVGGQRRREAAISNV